jgi:adenosylcobinamide kinase / adenosylcobinamide-phosphate guanylyltransferase
MTFHDELDRLSGCIPSCAALILVTGAARSGKSEWAEYMAKQIAAQSGRAVTYVATAQLDPNDAEWQARIAQHRKRRPPEWNTLSVPMDLPAILRSATASDCFLIDSLGTWLANLLEQDELTWEQTAQALITSLSQTSAQVIVVAEETGWGIVPAYPIGRTFRDRLGQLTRQIGMIANPVYLVASGHILNLSQLGTPLPSTANLE